jgi:membrane protease YdiL (CAAX protease family)
MVSPMPAAAPPKSWLRLEGATALLEGLPSRPEALLEVLFVLALVATGALRSSFAASLAFVALGVALVRPWRPAHGGVAARVATALVTIVAIGIASVPAEVPEPRRIGIDPVQVTARLDDPRAQGAGEPGGVLEIRAVSPSFPASSVLRPGDRIVALDGAALEAKAPLEDLRRRLQVVPGDAVSLTLVRDRQLETVRVGLPSVAAAAHPAADAVAKAIGARVRGHVLLATVVRAVCVLAFIALLLRARSVPLASLGLSGQGLDLDAIAVVPLAAGAFAVSIATGLAVGAVTALLHSKLAENEATARSAVLLDLVGGTPVAAFVVAMIVTAAFEEVVFRGFLLPRLRLVTGSWGIAIAVSSMAFGAGHLYEGRVAILQTTALGVFFSLAFLRRRRLLPVMLAHALFNVAVFGLITLAQRSGALPRP